MKNQYRGRRSREAYDQDEPGGRDNLFGWTIFLLGLTGLALLCWLGSFYVFGHPEKPFSYRLLQKLNKLDPPKRFELTQAPSGRFQSPEEIYERVQGKTNAELRRFNDELKRNFINNYQHMSGLVPYLVGEFEILNAYELSDNDVIESGYVTLSQARDFPQVLVEHIFPSNQTESAVLRDALAPGTRIPVRRTLDLHALLHVERLGDGRVQLTLVPIDYQGRSAAAGIGMLMMQPPEELNIEAGWPVVRSDRRELAEETFQSHLTRMAGRPAAERESRELVRVAQATPTTPVASATPSPTPPPPEEEAVPPDRPPAPIPEVPFAEESDEEETDSMEVAVARPEAGEEDVFQGLPVRRPTVVEETPPAEPEPEPSPTPVASPTPTPTPAPEPQTAATSGGWTTYAPGRMPRGRLVGTRDLGQYTGGEAARERLYLAGQFTVTAAGENRAILRSQDRGPGAGATRIIVDYPPGRRPPVEGSALNRDGQRPFEITEIRRSEDGLVNVYVREIIDP